MTDQLNTTETDLVFPGERVDDLQRDGLVLIQSENRFRYGVDAVLLSWYAKVKNGENVLDLCTGSGVVPILLTAKTKGRHFTGLEIQEEVAEMAKRSVLLNHLSDRVEIVQGDVKEASSVFGGASFDVVTVNPPYLAGGAGLLSADPGVACARHEVFCTLQDVLMQGAKVLRPGGRFYMVHRPFRLTEIFAGMSKAGMSPSRLCMVYPKRTKEAGLVLVEGVRGGRTELRVDAPVILMEEDGSETLQVRQIHGRA